MAIEVTIVPLTFDSDETPKTVRFEKSEIAIGRAPICDIVLNRSEVSVQHAKIEVDNEPDDSPTFSITDLDSLNGTVVENTPLRPHVPQRLGSADRVIIGSYLIKPKLVGESLAGGIEVSSEKKPRGALEILSARFGLQKNTPLSAGLAESAGVAEHTASSALVFPQEKDFHAAKKASALQTETPISSGKSPRLAANGASVSGSIGRSSLVDIDFSALRLVTLSGTVRYKGKPLSGVDIDGGPLGRAQTGTDGRFSFTEVLEGTEYKLRVQKKGFSFTPRT